MFWPLLVLVHIHNRHWRSSDTNIILSKNIDKLNFLSHLCHFIKKWSNHSAPLICNKYSTYWVLCYYTTVRLWSKSMQHKQRHSSFHTFFVQNLVLLWPTTQPDPGHFSRYTSGQRRLEPRACTRHEEQAEEAKPAVFSPSWPQRRWNWNWKWNMHIFPVSCEDALLYPTFCQTSEVLHV